MRPPAPEPGTWARSMLLSLAILRTRGEERACSAEVGGASAIEAAVRLGSGFWRRGCRYGRSGSRCGCSGSASDDGDDGVDLDGRAGFGLDLGEDAGCGRGDLGVDLVGGDFKERLVALDFVSYLLEPLGDGAFEDGLAHLRHDDFGCGAGTSLGGRHGCCGRRFGGDGRRGLRSFGRRR